MKRSAFCEVLQEILKQNMFLTWNPAFKQLQTGNSFHEKDQSLRLWSGSTDSKTIGYQRTNPSVQFNLVIQSCPTLCESMNRTTPGLPVITNTQSLLKVMSIELVMPSNHLILCHTLLLLPSIFPNLRVFSNESVYIRWPSIGVSASASVLLDFQNEVLSEWRHSDTYKGRQSCEARGKA